MKTNRPVLRNGMIGFRQRIRGPAERSPHHVTIVIDLNRKPWARLMALGLEWGHEAAGDWPGVCPDMGFG